MPVQEDLVLTWVKLYAARMIGVDVGEILSSPFDWY
jgi:hypothetical protein